VCFIVVGFSSVGDSTGRAESSDVGELRFIGGSRDSYLDNFFCLVEKFQM
jgi:hypothetical protein